MRRYMALLGLALAACVIVPATASAQVVIVGRPAYYPPVVTYSAPPVVTYSAPVVVPQSTTTYSYYSSPPVVTYSSPVVVPQSVVTYSSPAPVVTYSAPIVYSSPGVVTTRSYYGLGIFRPRGWYTETYVRP
ncbi:MAG TPA: hypothetical protein VFE62_13175 [Gemmataceae bacterium]|nr:hypothetical protein [Gemmataceae bacterium]